eukprot:9072866-Pyramimonas_sp.AAC.1
MHGSFGSRASGALATEIWERRSSIAEFLEMVLRSGPPGIRPEAWAPAAAAARAELTAAATEERRPRPQRILSSSLEASLFPDSLPTLLHRRISSWLPDLQPLLPADLEARWG